MPLKDINSDLYEVDFEIHEKKNDEVRIMRHKHAVQRKSHNSERLDQNFKKKG